MRKKRVVVAMSGGVDSSVAAALLKNRGYDVIGITMDIFSPSKESCLQENYRSCCGRNARADAVRVAACLDIPHYVVNLKKEFREKVINDFCDEYAQGRTPNPCVRCNRFIKFDALWKKAKAFEADYLATGHHARIIYDKKLDQYFLLKGKDPDKEQSYFLYTLTQQHLSRTFFPIGDYSKHTVRKMAKNMNLPVHHRPESQEICFIPDDDYISFLEERFPEACCPGSIVDLRDQYLGRHNGIIHFTIGQRKGMGLAAPYPLYVLEIRADKNQIVVGRNEHLFKRSLVLSEVSLITKDKITHPISVKAKIRYKQREAPAQLSLLNDKTARLKFEKPQRAVTSGQSAVFYRGDVVLGGGIIEKAEA